MSFFEHGAKDYNSILKKLNKKDQIKFVVKDQKDYDYAKQIIVKEKISSRNYYAACFWNQDIYHS